MWFLWMLSDFQVDFFLLLLFYFEYFTWVKLDYFTIATTIEHSFKLKQVYFIQIQWNWMKSEKFFILYSKKNKWKKINMNYRYIVHRVHLYHYHHWIKRGASRNKHTVFPLPTNFEVHVNILLVQLIVYLLFLFSCFWIVFQDGSREKHTQTVPANCIMCNIVSLHQPA